MDIFLQTIVNGILYGSVIALFSIGLTLIFGVMDVVNFAHGEYIMLSIYGAYGLHRFLGIDPYTGIPIVAIAAYFFGIVSERSFIRPIINQAVSVKIIVTLGISIIFQNLALVFFSPNTRAIQTWYTVKSLHVGGIEISLGRLIAMAITIFIMIILHAFLNRTKYGLAIRATAQDKTTAQLMGMPSYHIYTITFGISILLTSIAGCCLAALYPFSPTVGTQYVLIAFVVVVLGGLGNINGALVAGLFIGSVHNIVGTYLDLTLAPPIYYGLFITVLILRAVGYLEKLQYKLKSFRGGK